MSSFSETGKRTRHAYGAHELKKTERSKNMRRQRTPVPPDSCRSVVSLGSAEGKPLKKIEVCQSEDALNVDVQFEDDHVLELTFHVGFQASSALIKWDNGNSHVVQR